MNVIQHMTGIKNILLLIITIYLLGSCTNGNSNSTKSETADNSVSDLEDNSLPRTDIDTPSGPSSSLVNLNHSNPSDFSGCPNRNASDLLMVPVRQEEAAWCWAACGEMVMEKIKDTSITQCDEAEKRFRLRNCCDNFPRPDECINGGIPEFEEYGFLADSTQNQPLSWEDLKKQIDCQKKPFVATWQWIYPDGRLQGGGHMMVISGYKRQNNIKYVYILNPDFDDTLHARWKPYSMYVSGLNYVHWNDYYNIRKK
jgi:hypothetical protein